MSKKKKDVKKETKVNEKEKLEKKSVDLKKEETKNKEVSKDVKKEESKKPIKLEEKAVVKNIKKPINDKIVIFSIIAAVILITVGIFGFYYYETSAKPVATFDGGSLTVAEYTVYYKTFAPMLGYYGYKAGDIPEQIAKKAGIDKILLKMAKEAGADKISDEDKAKVEETFNNEDTLKQFEEQGINVTKLKELYCNDYIISAYIKQMAKEAEDEKVIEYIKSNAGENATLDMNEYVTRHILIKTTDSSGTALTGDKLTEAQTKAEGLLAKVKAGEDIATLAKENSEDTGTKEDGGKFLMYMDGNVMTQYADAVKTLKAGTVYATLVKTDAGYHIIKLESITENGRKNNTTEREAYINTVVDKLNETKNLKINDTVLNNIVKKITGKTIEELAKEAEESSTSTDSNITTDTSTDATTTEGTTQTTTAQ